MADSGTDTDSRQSGVSRRQVLRALGNSAAPLAVGPWCARPLCAAQPAQTARFFFVTDTHYLAQKSLPARMDARSAGTCRRLVDTLNRLEGEQIPGQAGGGMVGTVDGVIHGGDLVDSADKRGGPYTAMIATEFAAFERDYGLTGSDGRLRYPVYEVHGNHDGPQGDTLVVDGIRRRNLTRPGLTRISDSGLHYSWDWGPVHFINLGIVVGESGGSLQRRRYAPHGSLAFLREDLRAVNDVHRPVVITQHIDVARYSLPYGQDEDRFLHMEWHPQDVQSFHAAIRPQHVIASFFGHTHARNISGWNGSRKKTAFQAGELDLFNGDNASHFHSDQQAVFYVEISAAAMLVREIQTTDAWQTHHWTEQTWSKEI